MIVNYYNPYVRHEIYLMHHGVLGQKWGQRNGPPYPLSPSAHSAAEKKAGWEDSLDKGGSNTSDKKGLSSDTKKKIAIGAAIVAGGTVAAVGGYHLYKSGALDAAITAGKATVSSVKDINNNTKMSNSDVFKEVMRTVGPTKISDVRADYALKYKREVDQIIKEGTNLRTLSFDKDRTKGADMFFAAYKDVDKHQYNVMFNSLTKQNYDAGNGVTKSALMLKYKIDNVAIKDIKVASESSGIKTFTNLFKNDDQFRDFIVNNEKMSSAFDKTKYRFPGYAEAGAALKKIKSGNYTDKDLAKVYRMFNYVIPNDGRGNETLGNDVKSARGLFFDALKSEGYGAVLDTNDALYGGFHASSPVIVFDMENVALSGVARSTMDEKRVSGLVMIGAELLKKIA